MRRIVAVFSMLIIGAVSAQANLLLNSGFETGLSPWIAEGGLGEVLSINTTDVNSGSQSGQFDFPGADGTGFGQQITIAPADRLLTYKLTYYVKSEGYGELLGIEPVVGEFNGVAWVWQDGGFDWIPASTPGWIKYTREFTMTEAAATHFKVYFKHAPQGSPSKVAGTVLFDDITLEVTIPSTNLIPNGDFESGTTSPWVADNGAALSISTASANSGSQSGQIDFPSTDLSGILQGFFIEPEDRLLTYTFSFSVNVEATGFTGDLGIRPTVGEWNEITPIEYQYGDIEWIAPGTTGWVTRTQSFTLTQADGTYLQPRIYLYPVGVAGSVLVDDILLEVAVEPFPMIDAPNLLDNGGFTQATNQVPDDGGPWWTVNGSLSDWSGFWGRNADLVGWSHYHADPNIPGVHTEIGTTNNGPDGAGFTLDGTDKFNTDFNTTDGILNLNSSGGYRNGMMQTLSGVTINPALTYDLTVDVRKNALHDHANATFTLAMTSGSGVDATNLANVVTDGLLQIPATNLSTSFVSQTIQLSGADLTGQLNVLIENVNTEIIPGFPFVDPGDVVNPANVSQVTIDGISLTLPVVLGDVDKDGWITWNDVDLANSYLDGSIDGGDDAATRQNSLIAKGSTSAEALAALNLVDFDIDGDDYFSVEDITALEALVPPMVIDSGAMDGSGNFVVEVSGMRPGATNHLKRTTDLMVGSFPDVVDTVVPAGSEATMTDTNAPAGEAFYQVTEEE